MCLYVDLYDYDDFIGYMVEDEYAVWAVFAVLALTGDRYFVDRNIIQNIVGKDIMPKRRFHFWDYVVD